jgi:chromosome segregation ATPase
MADELAEIVKRLDDTDKKIDEISKQWVVLRHEYRSTRDKELKVEIKKKWDKFQKKMETLEKRRRKIIEEKSEINFKRRWKGWK